MCISASQEAWATGGVAEGGGQSRERDGEKRSLSDWQTDRHHGQLQMQILVQIQIQMQMQMEMQAQWLWALWTHHRHFSQKCKWLKCKWRMCACVRLSVPVWVRVWVWVWVWVGVWVWVPECECVYGTMLKCKAMLLLLRGSACNKMFYILFILVKYSKLCVCLSVFVNTMPKASPSLECVSECEWVKWSACKCNNAIFNILNCAPH